MRKRTEGFEVLAATVRDYMPELVENIYGIDRRDLVVAAKMVRRAGGVGVKKEGAIEFQIRIESMTSRTFARRG